MTIKETLDKMKANAERLERHKLWHPQPEVLHCKGWPMINGRVGAHPCDRTFQDTLVPFGPRDRKYEPDEIVNLTVHRRAGIMKLSSVVQKQIHDLIHHG